MTLIGALMLGGLAITAALTPAVMGLARRVGAVDRGGYRKEYRGEMPLLGGLAIAGPMIGIGIAAGTAGYLVFGNWKWVWSNHRDWFDPLYSLAGTRSDNLTLAIGAIGIVALGLVDDIKGLRARWKLAGQVAVALFVCLAGYTLTTVSLPLIGSVELGIGLGTFLTMLWIVGLINAFNLIDGIDGLAAGIALIGAGALVVLSIIQGNVYVTFAGAALTGTLVAFLLFNFPPAKIFLGDTGSMFLGYALAMMSLLGAQKSEAAVIIFAPMLALSLPLFETAVSIVRRYVRGLPIFAGDSRHTHHRLLRMGYSQPRVVLTLCGTALLLGTAAVMSAVISDHSRWAWFPYALYVGALANIAWLAGYLRPSAFKSVLERRQSNRIFQALGRYAALRLNSGLKSSEANLVLELCRHELGLRHIEIRMRSGTLLVVCPDGTTPEGAEAPHEELLVKTADGQDIVILYEMNSAPDPNRRQDVAACLAGIFDGMRVNGPVSLSGESR
jgi:UDP-GlcNAc:undecaprenyl-phosphate/decaprenyl-phosphate GlcNAc-1-phosphate transferase